MSASATSAPHAKPVAALGDGPRERRGVALMVAGGLLLGTIGVFVEEAAQHPLTTVWFRCAFGGVALLLWGAASGRLHELRLRGRALAAALAAGVLMIANWALFFAAIERTSIARGDRGVPRAAAVGDRARRVVVARTGDALATRRRAAGAGRPHAGHRAGRRRGARPSKRRVLSSGYTIGLLMCLGGSLSYAAVTLIAKWAKDSASSFALAWWQCAVGTVALAWWPVVHGWPAWGSSWAWLAGLGVIHTGLAYVVLYAGMARLSTSRIALLQFVYPAAAVMVDWLVYGRALSAVQLGGRGADGGGVARRATA